MEKYILTAIGGFINGIIIAKLVIWISRKRGE